MCIERSESFYLSCEHRISRMDKISKYFLQNARGGASQRKSCVASSSGKIWKDPYRVECIDENNTLSTHYPYTQISPIHTKKSQHLKQNTLLKCVDFTPLFVCTHFRTTLPFQTPLSTRKFGRAGYSTFSSTRSPRSDLPLKGSTMVEELLQSHKWSKVREWSGLDSGFSLKYGCRCQ